jgi:hypothetical protein
MSEIELPPGVSRDVIVALARELAAEMARTGQASPALTTEPARELPPQPARELPPRPARELPPRPARELPPRPARELPPRAARELPARTPSDARPARSDVRPSKPDARPMRFVYGAGAVAAMSVMAVGLVQPDFAATADQSGSSDAATVDPNLVAQAPADVAVRHVTQYVHLQPGQTAPPGATVIAANAPTPQVVVTHNQPANPPAAQPAARPPAPAPKPATRQSGRPTMRSWPTRRRRWAAR